MSRPHTRLRFVATPLVLLGSLWLLYAAMWKVANYDRFEELLRLHGLIPTRAIGVAAITVPLLESAAAIGSIFFLVSGHTCRGAFVLALAFLCLGGYALAMAAHPPRSPAGCGCGLSPEAAANWAHVAL